MSAQANDPFIIDQIRCPECSLTCLQKNIYRHMAGRHSWTREDCKVLINAIRTEKKSRETKTSFVCSYCSIMFGSIKHLVQHKRICEQPEMLANEVDIDDELLDEYLEEVVEEEVITEYIIDDKASTSANFELVPPHRQTNRQIPDHHLSPEKLVPAPQTDEKTKFPSLGRHRGTQTKCPECPSVVESIEELLNHCRDKHEVDDRKFFIEKRIFDSKDEFKKWFDQRQEDTCTSLTKRTGHGGETFYRCHRVGKYQSVAKARKSNPRKIDQTCTAYLKVFTQDDGSTFVHGCFTHIGHELDHKLLWLTETQENYVRELIDLGWNSDQIFFYIREEYRNYECKLKYISKNDIRNITVRYTREKQKRTTATSASVSASASANQLEPRIIKSQDDIDKYSAEGKDALKPEKSEKEKEEEEEDTRFKRMKHDLITFADLEDHEEEIVMEELVGEENGQELTSDIPETSSTPPDATNSEESTTTTTTAPDEEYINVVDDEPSLETVIVGVDI